VQLKVKAIDAAQTALSIHQKVKINKNTTRLYTKKPLSSIDA
jgi:hypothetical protein